MAISFFESKEGSNTYLPFVEEYVKSTQDFDSTFKIHTIAKTRKGNGYMCYTDAFSIFLYSNAAITSQLIEALQVYVDSGHGYQIVAVTLNKDPYYKLGVDLEKTTNWLFTLGKYSVLEIPDNGLVGMTKSTNPFLPPLPSTGRHKTK